MPTSYPNSPRLVRGGIVTMDVDTSTVQNIIAFQYNPETLTRTLQIQSTPAGQDGARTDALRLRGPANETIKVDVQLDAADQLEFPDQFPLAVQHGIYPQIAQLEMLVNPSVETLESDEAMANAGTLEIIPLEQPVTLFVWSSSRIVPVRLTDFSITEEAFDPHLNPIRAKVSLGMRVLTIDDVSFQHPAGRMFMTYLTNKEQLASQVKNVAISVLGLGGLP